MTPGFYGWQKFDHSSSPLPGSATAVGRHLLASILTQFGERRLFIYLFSYNHGTLTEAVFAGIASSLDDSDGEAPADQAGGGGGTGAGGDKEGELHLYQTSPIKYFLEVHGGWRWGTSMANERH